MYYFDIILFTEKKQNANSEQNLISHNFYLYIFRNSKNRSGSKTGTIL